MSEAPRARRGSSTNQLEGIQIEIGVALLAAIVVGCGGGSSAGSPRTEHAARTLERDDQKENRDDAPERRSAAAPPSPADRCTDGTCFPCGSGYCPNGFYCDLNAKGGAACSWLPACAKDASCTCVTRAFGSCTCATEGGGAQLSCPKN